VISQPPPRRAGDSRAVFFATLSYFWSKLLPLLTETGSHFICGKKSACLLAECEACSTKSCFIIDRPADPRLADVFGKSLRADEQ